MNNRTRTFSHISRNAARLLSLLALVLIALPGHVTADTTAPEMYVTGNGHEIVNGDTSPSLTDYTNLGEANTGHVSNTVMFKIYNTGNAPLHLTGVPSVTIGGTDASQFSVNVPPAKVTLEPGGNTYFTLTFNPSSTGVKTAVVSIPNDDANENPYTFTITGTGTGPEISVTGNGREIVNGDDTPSLTDFTDFGAAAPGSGSVVRSFTITNSGTGFLELEDVYPYIAIQGENAADFTVTSIPTFTVPAGQSMVFQVEFHPNAAGLRRAAISIINNDGDENPYTFSIQGNGTGTFMTVVGHEITISDGDTSPQADDLTDFGVLGLNGESKEHTFTIFNNGTEPLYLNGVPLIAVSGAQATDFKVTAVPVSPIPAGSSSHFRITFDPSAPGVRSATISIANAVTPLDPYDFTVQGTGMGPDMSIFGNGQEIIDGDTSPSAEDFTDFGQADLASGSVVRTFTIMNTGPAPVNLTGTPPVAISGAHAADFTVTAQPSTAIPATTGSTTFQVTFDPSGTGLRSATISITNTDPYHNPYNFNIQGTGTSPEIRITGDGRDIASGSTATFIVDLTDFGTVDVTSGSVVHTFVIENTGNGELALTGTPPVTVNGASAADFTVTAQAASSLAGGASTSFQVTFNPSGAGLRTATVSIASNDLDENPYTFTILGNGSTAGMAVTGNGNTITDGDITPRLEDLTDFGNVSVAGGTVEHTFIIYNTGSAPLNLTGAPLVAISGAHAADFTVTVTPATTLAAGTGSTNFRISFGPSAAGIRNATVTIANSDGEKNPYTFSIRGTGIAPEINIKQNVTNITNGSTYNFGSHKISTDTDIVFTVLNTGTDELAVTTPLTISGADAEQFSIVTQPDAAVIAGGSTAFTVRFTPADTGTKTAVINIFNNVSNKSPYTLVIKGTGTETEPTETTTTVTTTTTTTTTLVTTQTVAISGFTGGSLTVDNRGVVEDAVLLTSSDDSVKLEIAAGTRLLDSRQEPLTELSVRPVSDIPAPPPEGTIVAMYEFGDDGATFDPAITLRIPHQLQSGEKASLAYWDGSAWVFLVTTYDQAAGELVAEITHFSLYAVIVTDEEQGAITTETSATTGTPGITQTDSTPTTSTGTADGQSNPSWYWWLIIAIGIAAAVGGVVQYQRKHRGKPENTDDKG